MSDEVRIEPWEAELAPLDISSYLDTPEARAEFLTAALEDGDPKTILVAIGHAAKAHGMSDLAGKIGVGRQSLYKSLSPEGNPSFETVLKLLTALGVRLAVEPQERDAA